MSLINDPRFRFVSSIGTAVVLLLTGPTSVLGRVSAGERCAGIKAKASALAVYAQVQCEAKAAHGGKAVDPQCLAKTEAKLRRKFAKAEATGACPGDADEVLAVASACASSFGGAVTGDATCVGKKLKAMGAKARDAARCLRKAAAKGPEATSACLEKVDGKFSTAVAKAERDATCTGTAAELEALVDACVATLPALRTCSAAGGAACNGTCPAGLACRPYEVFENGASVEAGCSCVDVVNGPECGTPVCGVDQVCEDPTFVCEQWTADEPLACDHTICQPAMVTPTTLPPASENTTPCDGGEFPTCGGSCPEGLRCQSFEGFSQGFAVFAGCLCVDPRAPRCEATSECDVAVLPFSHCADPSLTCLVELEIEGEAPVCIEAHCGMAVPTTTSTSITTTSSTSTSTSTTSTSTSTSTTTSTLPCTSTPSVSGCFEDLGDCTIRDTCTGLQWERKQMVAGPHDVGKRYVWAGCCEDDCQTLCQPNEAASATCLAMAEVGTEGCGTECPVGTCYVERGGIAVTTIFDWINQLNAEHFAGHDDWRLPAEAGNNPTGARELESILHHPCTGTPCIDPIFGPTTSNRYWSRTADVNRSVDAWFVNFFDGTYDKLQKREALFVRAVR